MNRETINGIERAAAGAEAHYAGWCEAAGMWLAMYTNRHHGEFMSDDVASFAYAHGLPYPRDGRAWGAVMLKAQKDGLIEKVAVMAVKKPCAHCRPGNVWRKV